MLRRIPRWTTWRLEQNAGGRLTKKPAGSTKDEANRRTFKNVQNVECGPDGGRGFVFTGGVEVPDGFLLALDLDACYFDGQVVPWAQFVLDAFLNSYTEVSPSGTGLRTFVVVPALPPPVPIIRVPADSPIDKAPEIQVFGCGPAQYVTVTGDQLKGTSAEPLPAPGGLGWLRQRYGAQMDAGAVSGAARPDGQGPPPRRGEVAQRLPKNGRIAHLAAGYWEAMGHPSASEGFQELEVAVLRAARDHVAEAASFLIHETAYGRGEVESRDPARYGREDWVTADLCRTHAKGPGRLRATFDDGFDLPSWRPPQRQDAPTGGWFLQLADAIERGRRAQFLLHGLLPARGMAQFFGDPSSGKTAMVVSLAIHVAAGMDWHGYELDRPGRVFYVAGEGLDGLGRRFEAQLDQVDPTLRPHDLPVYLSTRPGALLLPENRARWAREVRAVLNAEPGEPPALIVLDTQARNFGPGNENSSEDMGAFVDQVDALVRETGALVLLVHHTGHADKGRGRGSSAMGAALDASFEVTRPGGGSAAYATPHKHKDWARPDRIEGVLLPVQLGEDDRGRPVTAVTFVDRQASVADMFPEVDDGLLAVVRERVGLVTPRAELASLLSCSPKQARRRVDAAVVAGWLAKAGEDKNRSYVLTEPGLTARPTGEGQQIGDLLS